MTLAQHFRDNLRNMIEDGTITVEASDLAEEIYDEIFEYIDYDRLSTKMSDSEIKTQVSSVIEMCLQWHRCGKEVEEKIRQASALSQKECEYGPGNIGCFNLPLGVRRSPCLPCQAREANKR